MQAASTSMGPVSAVDATTAQMTQMNKFRSYVNMLIDPIVKDDIKLKATQEISENLEKILSSSLYPSFLDHSMKIFLKILQDGEPHFIAEYNIQQARKLILEILHRLPPNDTLKPYVKSMLSLTLKLLEIDNEENVLVCLKIIIELHKQYRPPFNDDIQHFLQFVKTIYSDLPSHMNRIFEPRLPIKVKDLSKLNIEELLQETFTITTIQTEMRNKEGAVVSYNLIPKAVLSLKVIQELPIIVVLMYQLYKQSVDQDVSDFIPLIMKTIVLQPSAAQRQSETFNKEIFVDFMGAQIKSLSFLAYIIKIYQEVVSCHSKMLVQGMLGLLTLCPMEVAHLRRELLIASRHILATELRNKFVPYMERLFDEEVLLGRGWTTHESLRPLAYSTLADLVHHVRQQLNLADIARAVHLFSKNVHDDSLATTIQTMSCKLLLNLVECIKKRVDIENSTEGRGLLMRMLEVFVLKFKTIAKIQLPKMTEKCKTAAVAPPTSTTAGLQATAISTTSLSQGPQADPPTGTTPGTPTSGGATPTTQGGPVQIKTEDGSTVNLAAIKIEKGIEGMDGLVPGTKEEKSKFGFPQPANYNVTEYRSLVKTLVCGVKTITWGVASCKPSLKQFQPHETLVFIRLVKWALKALDIYTLNVGPQVAGPQRMTQQSVRNKEEKEVLEHFSSVFSMMHAQTFHEIFSTTIEYVVERVYKNSTLQTVPNTLLANPTTSPIFATVLVEYLLDRMKEMGSNQDRSNLYLKLFKLVFGSVSLFPQENEKMLRPHLHQIVNRSMELAMSAKDPFNYFLLLRALFRSIGGGSHDLLYQEFLPLLPNLLEGLNRLQSGLHKQHMKDLFVELCLTVPVRLSSLLPYLPMLMDPLVSALNGSHVLISQGLRTLELCVDNLQHDFLYEHIQPVRADLMQALWRTLRNHDHVHVAMVAFKVLGKFGGGNRKMMIEPQRLEYVQSDYDPPAILAEFPDQKAPIEFPVEKVIETAFNALKQSTTDSFYRKQAWEVISSYLTASLDLQDDKKVLLNLFMHPSYQEVKNISHRKGDAYKSVYKQARETHKTALIGMFVAVAIKELRTTVISTLGNIVRHYTMVAVAQQSGAFAASPRPNEQVTLDPLVLIDALAVIMGHEEKELIKPGHIALVIILDTAAGLLGSRDLACRLPMVEYIAEKMCALCYERAWYAKLGGCYAIGFLIERGALGWVYEHMFTFLKALLFVMMDLTGEVSSGALDQAKNNLEKMIIVLVTPSADTDEKLQAEALRKVTHELVRQVTSPHTMVREQSMASLRLLAEKQGKTVTAVMMPFRDVLADMVPPTKHLLKHQPAIAQMGLMDGNMFCTTLEPRLFTIDMATKEHKQFITDLISLCETDDLRLMNLFCYKSISNFTPLRMSALRVLAACHYLEDKTRKDIFKVLYNTLEKPNPELQQTAFECMKSFIAGYQVKMEMVHETMRPLMKILQDVKNVSLNNLKMLSYLTQLFPNVFNDMLCNKLITLLGEIYKTVQTQVKTAATDVTKKSEEEQKIVTILTFFHKSQTASAKYIESLCHHILQTEAALLIEASSPFREPLMKFLLRYPIDTLNLLVDDLHIRDQQYSRYLEYILKHQDGKPFRDYIQTHMVDRLITLALANISPTAEMAQMSPGDRNEMQYQAIRIVYLLIRKDEQWLSTTHDLVNVLKMIWCNDEYQARHKNVDTLEYTHWREPKMLVKILLHFFCHHPNKIDLLFQLLRALCDRFIPEFQFLRDFLENTVAQNYQVEWKRQAFFLFVDQFTSPAMSQELKTKVLQLVIIPCFAVSFERGEGNKLIGTMPSPYQDNPENIVSVFINKLIDPETTFPFADCVRIALLQCSCLLVEQASPHIHDKIMNKAQSFKLRRLMTFAWPCLLVKNCVDAATRYHGHLLLSHIIDKFAIHRKIVLQVFHSLLKAHSLEARNVVRQALEILTPSVPLKLEEGHKMLTHWTKKIIVDEGHSMQQLFHILQLVVKHYKVYYPVRHNLVQYMVTSIQRLGFNPTGTFEHRKLAVELSEVIIKWELYGIREEVDSEMDHDGKRPISDPTENDPNKKVAVGEGSLPTVMVKTEPNASKPIERVQTDTVLNFLLRLACQVNDQTAQTPALPTGSSPGEILSRRCVALLKTALKPDVWPQQIDLKLGFFDKILQNVDQPNANIASICTALELLTFLLTVMKKDQILINFKPLQRGIGACVSSNNNKIIRLVHSLLHKLMELFPTERANTNMSCRHEELEILYSTVAKVISEGLNNYEKNTQATTSSLYGTIMILKAACMNNYSYIDLLITSFMKVLTKIAKEHLQPTNNETMLITSELLILSLDLVKTRVVVMSMEMRKTFIGSILVNLIDKTTDIKVMKAIVKMMEEWIKNKNVITLSQAPNLREKSILLVKLMHYVEKKFPDDNDLNAQFLELINFVYTDDQLKQTELSGKLEPAFLSGLRCTQPHIRAKFFKVFDESMQRRLHDRLLYITSSQNWEAIGPHYWIKQCIELLLVTANSDTKIQMSHESSILPSITSVLNQVDATKREQVYANALATSDLLFQRLDLKEEVVDLNPDLSNQAEPMQVDEKPTSRTDYVSQTVSKHYEFIEMSRNTTSYRFLVAAAQLCHMDTGLAEQVWLAMFPKFWSVLDDQQRQEIQPFIASGAHSIQKDSHPSAINTFIESLSRCQPPLQLPSPLIKYLAKSHNLWHRIVLTLEQMAHDPAPRTNLYEFEPDLNPKLEVLDNLGELYSLLCEEDMWAGLWQRHAHYKETNIAIAYEQHGFFEQAQTAFENAMARYKQDSIMGDIVPSHAQREVLMWNNHWIRCTKELKQWDYLLEYAKNGVIDPYLVLESSWRNLNWETTKDALSQLEHACPRELQWKVTLYNGYLWVCNTEDKQQLKNAERYVEMASQMCLQEWRRLPHIVSHIHLPYLQAAQQIMELQEAFQIRKGLQQGHQNSLHDMKAIVKTWRNRLPVIADDLSHWNDIFNWREHHYKFIIKHYEKTDPITHQHHPNSMLGVHASAQSLIHFGKIARKHKLPTVCLDSLNLIYNIPSVPVVDCFQKIRQQIKCYLQQGAAGNSKNEYQEGLDTLNKANVKYFSKEMNAEFYALKGLLYHLSGKSDEANKSFSAGLQLHDMSIKAWGLYGDYLEAVFTRDPRQIQYGINAIACFLHACRHQNESKARKHLAKVLWLLSYDDDESALMKALDKYAAGVPPLLWLPWTPQLLNCLVLSDEDAILNLFLQIGKMFPQAVYFPIRTLYLTLRTATARKTTSQASMASVQEDGNQDGNQGQTHQAPTAESTIKASPPMFRCSKIMKMLRDLHTTVLSSLEGIADQMEWFRENWHEEVVRQLRQGLAKCYAIAFENRENVNEAMITPHILSFVKKLVSTFGIGVEKNITSSANVVTTNTASESLSRRAEATQQDPVFKEMKSEFTKDFDFSQTSALRLRTLIFKLKKWIKILENRAKMFNQSFLIEEKCRFLSNFTLKTAEVELPGEFLLPKHTHYYVKITRFMPRVDIVQKHNTAARRLYIRGHNGKIYPYLVVNDSGLVDARRVERVLQLLRMMNHYLGKQKETSKRFLHYTVPRVVVVSQQIRLVEDNVASVSLLDIYKKGCSKVLNIEHDAPINMYYERLAMVQSRGIKASHQVYRDILKTVQTNMVPRTLFKQWAISTFPSATDYWQFRKMFTLQLALACFAEYVLHLTRLNPDMMYLHQDSGLMNVSYFKFDVDDSTGELDTARPVPFRLTPNIIEYVSSIGVNGPLTAAMIAAARCFAYPNFKVASILKPILKDEMVLSRIKKPDDGESKDDKLSENEQLINMVNKAVTAISGRLTSLAHFDGVDSKVSQLVAAANNHDNLCRMDPAWHPWL